MCKAVKCPQCGHEFTPERAAVMTRGGTGELDGNGRSGYSAELAQKTVQDSITRRGHRKPATAQ